MKTPAPGRSCFAASLRRAHSLHTAIIALLMPGLTLWTIPIDANPTGGIVVNGDVSFGGGAGNLQITQGSQKAIIDWADFSINEGELTEFFQPNAQSIVLNRVTGGNPSAIFGALKANGNVFVINPNGILVGQNGSIDVNGLVLSTLDVSNGEFLAGGDQLFQGDSGSGNVTNMGRINAIGGDVFLLGRTVTNTGDIKAKGTAGLAAGEEVLLSASGAADGERLFVRATGSGASGVGVLNDGSIEGAAVELKAHGNMYALAINNKGSVRAIGSSNSGGRVFLRGAGGTVSNSGSIRATGPSLGSSGRLLIEAAYAKVDGLLAAEGGAVKIVGTESVEIGGTVDVSSATAKGGVVVVQGDEIALGSAARVDASGATGGGYIRIGGGFQGRDMTIANALNLRVDAGAEIAANAYDSGAGGVVILWADGDTLFHGDLSAYGNDRGGFAEISGKQNLSFDGTVDLTSAQGAAGTLLLDPTDVTISSAVASASNINNVALSATLDGGTNVVITSNFGAVGPNGNITVNDRVEWYQETGATTPGTLTLLATGNINFNRSVRSAGTGGINVVAGWDGVTGIAPPPTSLETTGIFDMAAVLATLPGGANAANADAAGNAIGTASGSVFINTAAGTQNVEVGSRFGATVIAAHDMFLTAGTGADDRWAQVGFHDSGYEYALGRTYNGSRNEWWGDAAGNVRGKNYITDLGGTAFNVGGQFLGSGYGATGAITVGLSGRLDMRGANNRSRSYVQIGHGGTVEGEATRADGGPFPLTTRDGFIMDPAQDNNRPYFGATWRTNYLGHVARINAPISVTANEDILVSAARAFETTAGYTDMVVADQGSGSYALIGHGGNRQAASLHGNISVVAFGATVAGDLRGLAGSGIQLRGSNGSGSFAQIGHGTAGSFNRRTIWDQQASGNVTVTATTGAIRAIGFNQLPRAGTTLLERNTGAILGVTTQSPVNSAIDAETLYSHVQIGHGGSAESAPTTGGGFTAPVSVVNLFTAFNTTFANPGTAVATVTPEQSMIGNITTFAGGTVQIRDNMGYDALGNWTEDAGPGTEPYLLSGGILRNIGIEVRAGNNHSSYGMIGHGGTEIRAIDPLSTGQVGNITVTADKGGIFFAGGEERRSQRSWGFGQNFAQIGHGGVGVQGPKQGSISVSAGQGVGASGGDLIFRSGRMRQSHAQIGHGGHDSNTRAITGDGLSDILVTAKGNVEFTSRISGPSDVRLSNDYIDWAMGERGSNSAGNAEGAERVVGTLASGTQIPQSSIQSHNWDTNVKYVMIGHGGNNVNFTGTFSLNNEVNVLSQEGSFRMTSGGGDRDFAQIGHGGYRSGGTPSILGGNLSLVTTVGDIIIDASNPGTIMAERSAMVGIVERDGLGNFLSLGQQQEIGRGFASYGMIGNGGYDMDGDHSGSLTVSAGGNLHMIGPDAPQSNKVVGYTAGFVEGASNNPASGVQNYWIGNRHSLDTLVEASMMQRSFQLYHGNSGASELAHKGNIIPGTLVIDLGQTGANDLRDAPNGDGTTGTLYRTAAAVSGNYAVGTHGVAYGTINYTTGQVTVNSSAVTANNGVLEDDRNSINRNIDYSYANLTTATNVFIDNERTPESDTAIRPNEAFLGHGRINPTTVRLVIDGDGSGGGTRIFTDTLGNGELRNNLHQIVGDVDYATGRVRFRNNVNPTGDEISVDYTWVTGSKDSSFVQLGNGGLGSSTGGRNSAGHTGQIQVTADGDIRLHGGAHANAYAQLGHGGEGSPSRMGAQTDGADLSVDVSGNITVNAGGIVEVLAGRGFTYFDSAQYGMLGHGGRDTDGHHQGNIIVNAGTGAASLAPGVIGGGAQAGLVFTSGQTTNAFSQLGHGGSDSQSAREDGDTGRRGFTGSITTNVVGDIRFTAGTGAFSTVSVLGASTAWDDTRNYTQLGHGGLNSYVRNDSNTTNIFGSGIGHNGAISVTSTAGSISFQGGDTAYGSVGANYGILHYAMLGHGGYDANGEHSGNITVSANQNITFRAGAALLDDNNSKHSFAQLGHGGDSSDGNLGIRDIGGGQINTLSVTATNGDIGFYAGPGLRNYAQIGFGGVNARGDHRAAITVNAGGDLNVIGGNAPAQVVSDLSSELDIATAQLGWVATRNRNLTATNVLVTTDYGTFTANTSNGVLIAATLTAAGTTAGLSVGQTVGQVNYMNGHVRFTTAISGGTIPVQFNNNGGAVEDNDPSSVLPSITNLVNSRNTLLDAAAMNPGGFSSPNLIATFNNTRGGLTNVVEAIGQRDNNLGIASGTFTMTIPTNGTSTLIGDNGSGSLVVTQVGAGSGLTLGATVGTIDYTDGSIRLTTVVNPGRFAGVTANYTLDRVAAPDNAYAQLGNGGQDSDNGNSFTVGNQGNISVTTGGDIRFHGGNGATAYTQMGHGGRDTAGANRGDIMVTGGGILEFLAGNGADLTDSQNYAQLGHGGFEGDGTHNGNITINVKSGLVSSAPGNLTPGAQTAGLNFRGGRTDNAYVQLGHGGHNARSGNATGVAGAAGIVSDISVVADGSIQFTAGTLREDISTNNDGQAYAMLGHGGYDADASDGNSTLYGTGIGHKGSILVQSRLGSVKFYGGSLANGSEGTGDGRIHFAQLGHGGFSSNGEHSGNITVLAGREANGTVINANSDIEFKGGTTSDNDTGKINYAQLGHGGRDATGNFGLASETITVLSSRDLTFAAGNDQDSYAMLGNGGQTARGNHSANIIVNAGRHIAFSGNVGSFDVINERTTDFHQATNLGATTLGTGQGDAIVDLEGSLFVPGTLRITIPGGPTLIDNPANATQLIVESNISVDVNGDTIPEVFTAGQVVGTIVNNQSNNSATRVTFTVDVNPDNRSSVLAPSTPLVSAVANYKSRENFTSWAQLGNGGYDSDDSNPGDNAASIAIPGGGTYQFDGYGIGGPTAAQRVGNQGNISVTSVDGNLTFIAGEANNGYVQLGHGGMYNDGDQIGDITVLVDADGSAGASGGNTIFDARGLNASGQHAAHLGHGGYHASGGHTGAITFRSGGTTQFFAGRDSSYAQIGHGGRNDHRLGYATVDGPAAGNSTDNDTDGNYATAGVQGDTPTDDRRDNANDRYFAGTHKGDITVQSGKSMTFTGYTDTSANIGGVGYVQIGHGGFRNAADPNSANGEGHNGAITVEAGGLTFNGSGEITAVQDATARITFQSGGQQFSYAQIGHGGYEAFGNHSGDLRVASAAGVDFVATSVANNFGDNRDGRYSYRQIGHGGLNADYDPFLPRALESTGGTVGTVFTENGTLNLYYAAAVAQLTPGVNTGQGSLMPLTTFNQTYVDPLTVRFVDHDNNVATPSIPIIPTNRGQWFHINAPGAPASGNLGNSGDISVVSFSGDLNLSGPTSAAVRGSESYVQVGHGGEYTGGNHSGDVSVIAQGGGVNLLAGQATLNDNALNSYAQIGHGGSWSGGTLTGHITVKALGASSRVNLVGGSDNQSYSQIGHGGYDANFLTGAGTQTSGPDANGVTTPDIRVLSGTELRGQNLQYWYNPNYVTRNDLRSSVTGNADNGLSDPLRFRFISGNINVVSAGGASLAGSTAGTSAANTAPSAYAQIGHGGRSTQSHNSGNILLDASGLDPLNGNAVIGAGGAITATAGNSDQTYVQVGHGGYDADGNHGTRDVDGDLIADGNITIRAGANLAGEGLVFRGGSRGDAFALVGHGGSFARSANWLDLTGPTGTGGPDGFADSAGNNGAITVAAGGSIVFVAGTGSLLSDGNFDWANYAQLGHGGWDADVHTQNIETGVTVGLPSAPNMQGTTIGHHGDISATSSAGRIIFYGGDPNRSEYASVGIGGGRVHYAQLGHGGFGVRGSHYGNITADAFSDILFSGGAGDTRNAGEGYAYVQLGHGGRSAQGDMGSRLAGVATETIRVRSGRDILFEAGVGQENYAHLGNGGRDARGDHAANIQVFAERNLTFLGSQSDHLAAVPGRTNGNTYQRTTADGQGLNDATNNLAGVSEVISLWNQKIIPGTVTFTILGGATALGSSFTDVRDSPTATTGTIRAADTTVVGTINYVTGAVTMTQPIHSGTDTSNNVRVTYRHTDSGLSYAQLGNGGYDSDNGGAATIGSVGDIGVLARTGHITFRAGNDDQTYAHLGHGGYETEGSNAGNIFVRAAGNIDIIGGTGNTVDSDKRAYAQIGHGGWGADTSVAVGHSGNVMVSSGTGALFSSRGTGVFNDVFDVDGNGTKDDVTFGADTSTTGLTLRGGAGQIVAAADVDDDDSSAQIGHGGRSAGGNHTGHIGVSATNDISLLGGSAFRSFTQIGHGGLGSSGNLSGGISVISLNGDLMVRAGAPVSSVNTFEAYSLIGHGDDRNNNQTENATGTRQGRIFVLADRITLDRSDNDLAFIGHNFRTTTNTTDPFATQTLTTPAENLGGGYEVIGRSGLANMNNGVLLTNGTISINDSFRDRYITPNLKDGNFAFSGGNLTIDTVIDSSTSYALPATHTRSVTFLAAGDIDVNRRISSPGSGAINLIAGARVATASVLDDPSRTGGVSGTNLNYTEIDHLWIPPTGYLNMAAIRADGLQWGFDNGFSLATGAEFDNAAGEISIDAANNGGNFNLGVGSKTGETNAMGYGVRVIGGDTASEYAQLGFNTDVAADVVTGSVYVSAKNDGVQVQSGTTTGTSAQIGHGGVGANVNSKDLLGSIIVRADYGSVAGNINVVSGTGDSSHAQIGHGGRLNRGSHGGDITVIGQGIAVTSGASSAQIGHGGFTGVGSYSGAININYDAVSATAAGGGGALTITAGNGFDDYAQIGHGGVVSNGGTRIGNIVVGQSASVSIQGGTNRSAYAQLGHGGVNPGNGTLSGNLAITTTGNVSVAAGNSGSGGTNGLAFGLLGHGGSSATGTKSGDITINSLGTQVTVAGSTSAIVASGNFGMIGHGGNVSTGAATGNIVLNAPNAGLNIQSGTQTGGFAKVGHGGFDADGAQSGSIDIDLGGNVNLTGSTADHTFAQIGHGGSLAAGNRDGAVSVETTNGTLTMTSGAGLNAYTQIGHGGVGATGNHGSSLVNGGIEVGVSGNILVNAGGGTDAYAQIGQGGSGAAGSHTGDICVHADGTITFNNGSQGAGTRAYVQVGHGGYNAAGSHTGEARLIAGVTSAGHISARGGSGIDQYVQVGHGGTNASGNHAGSVFIAANNGNLTFTGGSGAGSYVMGGHGDGYGVYGNEASGTTSGTRQGGIQYLVGGTSTLTAGGGPNNNVYLHHRTNDGGGLNLTTPTYLGGDGYQYVVNGTTVDNTIGGAFEGSSAMVNGNLGLGDVVVTFTGNLTLSNPNVPVAAAVNHDFDFIVLATGNLNFERNYQNSGTGDVALVAGWNGVQLPSTLNFAGGICDAVIIPGAIDFNNCDAFGRTAANPGIGAPSNYTGGILTIGSATQTSAVAVGTRAGTTILRGYGINLVGSNTTTDAYTQVGFRTNGTGDATGTIDVHLKDGGLNLTSGSANGAYTQIGHGGRNVTAAGAINALIEVSFCANTTSAISLFGGSDNAYAQIGHGGSGSSQVRQGDINLIGFTALTVQGGAGSSANARIGHAGNGALGNSSGNIVATGSGDLTLRGGAGTSSYAQFGHGGVNIAGTNSHSGSLTLTTSAGKIDLLGGGDTSYVLLGHGGTTTNGDKGTASDDILVRAAGAITLDAGEINNAYVQIGNGGLNSLGTHGARSLSVISNTGNISMLASTAAQDDGYVQIGHGSTQQSSAASGDIRVDARLGSVIVRAGAGPGTPSGTENPNFAKIGNGGHRNSAAQSGQIVVLANAIDMDGGTVNESFAQIGHGGVQADATADGNLSGDIFINFDPTSSTVVGGGGDITLNGGTNTRTYAQIGHGGSRNIAVTTGNIRIGATRDLLLQSGSTSAYTQIGHGGGRADANPGGSALNADITLDVARNLGLAGGTGGEAYSQIGHGGHETGAMALSGNILINNSVASGTGNVVLDAGSGDNAYAQIGHGGTNTSNETAAAKSGTITVARANNVLLGTSNLLTEGVDSYVQIGHGGDESRGDTSGTINVNATNAVTLSGGAASDSYAQIGLGGHSNVITNSGATGNQINVNAAVVSLQGGSAQRGYAQIGSGGASGGEVNDGAIIGDVNVNQTGGGTGAVTLTGGSALDSYAQIGNGGVGVNGDKTGNTRVSGASVSLTAGGGGGASAQIGAGGGIRGDATDAGSGAIITSTFVTATNGGVSVNALTGGAQSYAQIGGGGLLHAGTMAGGSATSTTVSATGAISLSGGAASNAYAQIGLGGAGASGNKTNAGVSVTGATVSLTAGGSAAANSTYAQIGSGGGRTGGGTIATADVTGNVLVQSTTGNIVLTGGTGASSNSYTQIGNGGSGHSGVLSGTVQVISAGAFTSGGGTGTGYYTHVGHGGNGASGSVSNADISVTTASGISLTSGGASSYAQIGHGGTDAISFTVNDADITLDSGTGDITLTGGAGTNAPALIGHGGARSNGNIGLGNNSASGNILVTNAANLRLTAGTVEDSFTQIGHAGERATSNYSGTININTPGEVSLQGGSGIGTLAMIGHGGVSAVGTKGGDITVDALGAILVRAGSNTNASAQIGHGASSASGDMSGLVNVAAGTSLNLTASNSTNAFAQVGHGGSGSTGNRTGNVTVAVGTDLTLGGGTAANAYTQIGHGGQGASGVVSSSDIVVDVVEDIRLTGGSANFNYAQIGHGGGDAINLSVVDGDVTVNAAVGTGTGVVALTGGAGTNTAAIIGHGGNRANGSLGSGNNSASGDIRVAKASSISLQGGGDLDAFAQIGHASERGNGTFSGLIDVTTVGGLTLNGGTAADTHAMIGHGGSLVAGTSGGNINVTTGNGLSLAAGSLAGAQAQIGHGGAGAILAGGVTGNLTVDVTGNLLVSTGTGGASSQIGHGGVNVDTTLSGDLRVRSTGTLQVTAATGNVANAFAQIGHGGSGAAGNKSGFVTVVSGGDLSVIGGLAASSYAQVGHGGSGVSSGNHSGSVSVLSAGNVNVTGGGSLDSGAMIGHGDSQAVSSGTRTGGLNIYATGAITLTDGAGAALVSHQSSDGATSLDYSGAGNQVAGDNGYSVVGLNGLTFSNTQLNGSAAVQSLASTIGRGLLVNHVTIAGGGATSDLFIGGAAAGLSYNSANTLTFAAGRDLTMNASYQNAGSGAINLVAGWGNTGSTALTAPIATGSFATPLALGTVSLPNYQPLLITAPAVLGEFGANSGALFVGNGAQTGRVAVGSKGGTTRALGYAVNVLGSDSTANAATQLGYFSAGGGATTGAIDLQVAGGGLTVEGGLANSSFAQIGHGGFGSSGGAVTGANISISFAELGDLTINGGGGDFSYGQIGHGGRAYNGATGGNFLVSGPIDALSLSGGTDAGAYAQFGHGGTIAVGSKGGTIDLTANSISIEGGSSSSTYAMVGHGGISGQGTLDGAISITSTVGNVDVLGSSGNIASAQIGHGGFGYKGAVFDQAITVNSAAQVNVLAGTGPQSSAMIGQGGGSAVGGSLSGDISVTAADDVSITAGPLSGSFAQIGNGGASADGAMSGTISVDSGGSVALNAVNRAGTAYAKIGHGDDYIGSNTSIAGTGARDGDIEVQANDDITLVGSLIGHNNGVNTSASPVTGDIQLAVSADAPSNELGGNLIADAGSEISAGDETRVYLPGRVNNQLAAGSIINGRVWVGAPLEPSLTQRNDEFTVRLLTGSVLTTPGEHNGTFNSGPTPATAESFAFYYDIIRLLGAVGPTGTDNGGVLTDRLVDDYQRELQEFYTGFNTLNVYYEGFNQYGSNGEAIYQFISSRILGISGGVLDPDTEDALRRLRARLKAIEEEAARQSNDAQAPETPENTDETSEIPSPPPVASVE